MLVLNMANRQPDSDFDGTSCSSSSIATTTASSLISRRSNNKPHKANHSAWEAISRLRQTAGRISLDHFRLLRRVGRGDIGTVYLCQIRNPAVGAKPTFYAMKVVDREAVAQRNKLGRAEAEKEILGMLDHPFCPTLYAEFEASHYSCLVMEYCPGGDLYAARFRQPHQRFHISSAKFYAAETLLAIEYLHMMGIVYRDLKPENVLVREDGHIMLSDFDLSFKCDVVPKLFRHKTKKPDNLREESERRGNIGGRRCSSPATIIRPVVSCFSSGGQNKNKKTTIIKERVDIDDDDDDDNEDDRDDDNCHDELVAEPINARSRSFVGTHEYLAPEVISGQGHGSAVDWWTFGVFLYEMMYGTTPFKGENNEKTLFNILKTPLSFPRVRIESRWEYEEMKKAEDLIRKLLAKNPKKRLGSLKGSAEIKRHELFKGVNWALIRSVRPPWVPSNRVLRASNACLLPKLMTKQELDAPFQLPCHRHHHHHQHHHDGRNFDCF